MRSSKLKQFGLVMTGMVAGIMISLNFSANADRSAPLPLPVDDPKTRQPDITRARTLLGWEPRVTLEQGLVKTIAYFRELVARGQA